MSQPIHPDARTRPGGTYETPTLLPAAGQERTYALIVAGIPLLLILLITVLPSLASADTGSSGSSGSSGVSGGAGGGWYAPPSEEEYSTEPYPSDPYPTEPYPSEEYTGTDDDSGQGVPSPSPSETVTPTGGPDATVLAYYDAINAQDYETAWELGGKNLGDGGYQAFVLGYQDTARAEPTVESVDGDTVTVGLVAEGTDGTRTTYRGTYTVEDGVITSGSMEPTGQSGAATP
ncbi:hypothetical protein U5640_30980 [Streptomyces sp. SS7]|uniref:hypothetical protein n=1 Tax=Streptomyces sp. SS7 TaxID=3108485 RepID=UPI0030EC80EF